LLLLFAISRVAVKLLFKLEKLDQQNIIGQLLWLLLHRFFLSYLLRLIFDVFFVIATLNVLFVCGDEIQQIIEYRVETLHRRQQLIQNLLSEAAREDFA